jgi:peptidoglycan hydrolase CwlO-like protein
MPGTLKVSNAKFDKLSLDNIDDLKQTIDTIQSQIQSLQASVDTFNNIIQGVEGNIDTLEANIEALQA